MRTLNGVQCLNSVALYTYPIIADIDLIVEFEDNTPDLYSIKQRLKNEVQSRFDLPVDICREKYIKSMFKQQILAEAKYA